mmetsp:Transcript_38842/g.77023  ORF Transcript_38842/g.77023 Transcript_38842/m.77023 type:complete len:112 (+) Transcript_38842:658-993(+)
MRNSCHFKKVPLIVPCGQWGCTLSMHPQQFSQVFADLYDLVGACLLLATAACKAVPAQMTWRNLQRTQGSWRPWPVRRVASDTRCLHYGVDQPSVLDGKAHVSRKTTTPTR